MVMVMISEFAAASGDDLRGLHRGDERGRDKHQCRKEKAWEAGSTGHCSHQVDCFDDEKVAINSAGARDGGHEGAQGAGESQVISNGALL
ncbi:MAG: hypothetical protein H7X74_01520 [Methyloceanibacter sp.]|nr:hypothetical protein [Methyloceanibacter sp.]